MSVTLSLDVELPDGEPFSANFTYNYGPMWRLGSGRARTADLEGLTGKESEPILLGVLRAMAKDPDQFRDLEPANGWGSFEGFGELVEGCYLAAIRNPEARWSAYR